MPSDKYEYPSEKLKQQAIKELKEDPAQVNAHIESFRRWVKSMPHLKCPTDGNFLLMFLRVAKFDHAKAQKRLDNFCTIRSSKIKGHPEMFEFPKITDPIIQKFLDFGVFLHAGITQNGEVFNVGSYENYNPKDITLDKFMKIIFMIIEMDLFKEECQVTGIKFFADMKNCGKSVFEMWNDPKTMKLMARIWQDCYPIRFKAEIIYREPAWYSVLFNIYAFFMHEKHKRRIYRIKDDMKKAFENIPDLEKLLPIELGGKGESKKDVIARMFKELNEFYKDGGPFKSISVDESKRPAETLKYLTEYADYDGSSVDTGTAGTFTKFDAL